MGWEDEGSSRHWLVARLSAGCFRVVSPGDILTHIPISRKRKLRLRVADLPKVIEVQIHCLLHWPGPSEMRCQCGWWKGRGLRRRRALTDWGAGGRCHLQPRG